MVLCHWSLLSNRIFILDLSLDILFILYAVVFFWSRSENLWSKQMLCSHATADAKNYKNENDLFNWNLTYKYDASKLNLSYTFEQMYFLSHLSVETLFFFSALWKLCGILQLLFFPCSHSEHKKPICHPSRPLWRRKSMSQSTNSATQWPAFHISVAGCQIKRFRFPFSVMEEIR